MIKKLMIVRKFARFLYRQASLNHLAQAARSILQNPTHVSQMLVDWNRLEFEFIRDQAFWICKWSDDVVIGILEEFKRFFTTTL